MTPTKQTVYLPVNGNQEKYVISDNDAGYFNGVIEKEGYFFTPEQLNEYTQGVIKQALETAAEKAKVVEEELGSDEFREIPIDTLESIEFTADKGYEECSYYRYKPSKKSITNTFEETYEKLKV